MTLEKLLLLVSVMLGLAGAIFLAIGILKTTPEIIAKQSQTYVDWNPIDLNNLTSQKANVHVGITLIALAFFIQIFNLVITPENLSLFKSHWSGVGVACLISFLILLVSYRVDIALCHKYRKETGFSLAKRRQGQLLKEKKPNIRCFEQVKFDAKYFFNMEIEEEEESNEAFFRKYTKKLGLELPQNIDLSGLENR